MILRRFMKHVKEQNWFAVGLDVIVVIVGIFLGLQVQAAYEAEQQKDREAGYLANLHEDIISSLNLIEEGLIERDFVEEGLIDILDSYAGIEPIGELTSLHCRALSISHKQANPISELPVARELISSGNLQLISNEQIRRRVSNYFGVLDLLRDRRTSTQLFMVDITGLYPDIIEIDLFSARKQSAGEVPENICNFELGRNNNQFTNHLAMNSARQRQLTSSIREQVNALNELHSLVDQELDINHRE